MNYILIKVFYIAGEDNKVILKITKVQLNERIKILRTIIQWTLFFTLKEPMIEKNC